MLFFSNYLCIIIKMNFIKMVLILFLIYLIYNIIFNSTENYQQDDPISGLCKNSHDFYKSNEDLCKDKIGSACNIKTYAMENPDACRAIGTDPCSFFEYLKDHIEECKKYTDPITNKPYNVCSDSTYFSSNKKVCRDEGFEMCKDTNYLASNVAECRLNGYDICKIDSNYVLNNTEECKNYGVDACSIKEYRYNYVDDCMKSGFNPCKEEDFLSNPKAIICGLGSEGLLNDPTSPCSKDGFLENEGNLSQCCSKGKVSRDKCKTLKEFIDPCFNEKFLISNTEECRKNGIEVCEYSLYYKINNPKECRDKGFDPCKVKDYVLQNIDECKALGFNPCSYSEYRDVHPIECNVQEVIPPTK
jgi:hypothetical protein